MDLSFLPAVNAALNASSTVLLATGFYCIKTGRELAHRRAMIGAFCLSTVFLVLYVLHKAWRGFENTPYNAEGVAKALYLGILFTHLTLAMTVPVMAIALIRFGLTRRLDSHRRLARVAWPVWMYVSITGVAIYVMLYHLNPPAP